MKWLAVISAIIISSGIQSQAVKKYEVIITEIMADPSPVIGLPNAEFVEIRNVSANSIDIFGWKLSDETGTGTINTHFMLQPDSIVVLCANSNVGALSSFGKTIGVTSFPSLDNDGDLLVLKTPAHLPVHGLRYHPDWYRVESKKQGGWTLEMIDTGNPCSGHTNWKASIATLGGTPARVNSVAGLNADETPPVLLRSYSTDSVSVFLVFDETIDSISAADLSAYATDGPTILKSKAIPPLYNIIELDLAAPMSKDRVYIYTITKLKDCSGNSIGSSSVKVGLSSRPIYTDIVVNEILFNPRSAGYDFVELYNNSNKIIDLSRLHLANRDINGQIASVKKLAGEIIYFFPGEYLVFTEDKQNLPIHYLVKDASAVIEISQLPSFPDDEGHIIVLDDQGNMLDEVKYSDDWHFALIANSEGISLERVDPMVASNKKDNWHSAASTAGYGTPGFENSQYHSNGISEAAISMSPLVFSPDNDGFDDILTISYQLDEQGFVGSITIFDMAGRRVRALVKNDLLAYKGSWNWDGLDEKKARLPTGMYIVFTEIFNLKGRRKVFKTAVVLARKT